MKQAAIDIGTNTVLLLYADSDRPGEMKVLGDVHSIARLGEKVDQTKQIRPEAYNRLREILIRYREILKEKNIKSVAPIATSAMRDAANREEIITKVKTECGFDIEILSGEDESLWSYRGAICSLPRPELQGSIATLDIGGGSTELSLGFNGNRIGGTSINIGAVRIRERFLSAVNEASVKSAREFIQSELRNPFSDHISIDKLIAVAGTPTALAAMMLKLDVFNAQKINCIILTLNEVSEMVKELLSTPPPEILKKYPAIHADRVDILPAGALILEEVLMHLNLREVQVSTYGLRYGIMIREFERTMKAESVEWEIC